MKVEKDIDKYIVYVYNKDNDIKKLVKLVISNLSKYYNIVYSSYSIKAYVNKYFGTILEISDGLYNSNTVNLKILKDTLFLYEVEDPLDYIKDDIYYYDNKFYVSIKNININLFEDSNIIYGREVYKIIGKGIKL